MKWLALMIAALAAAAVGGFAIYTFGRKDDSSNAASDEQAKAQAFADELRALCGREADRERCGVRSLTRTAPGVWKLAWEDGGCTAIHTSYFRPTSDGFTGAAPIAC
jgi:hypothetical protein